MQVCLLGPPDVVDGVTPVVLGGTKERTVLVVLALRADEVVSEATLLEALWGDELPRTATKTLQVYVARLRKALGPAAIETRGGGYRLRSDAVELDVTQAEQLIARARRDIEHDQHLNALAALQDAASLWRGSSLGDLAHEPALTGEAARLDELRLVITEERIGVELALGAHATAIPELERLCAAHPLREQLWRLRMLALYRSGRQAEALRAYQEFRRHLAEELGLEPSAELRNLDAGIAGGDPRLTWSAVADPGSSPAPVLPTGVITFLLTDIVGSSRLWEDHPKVMAAVVARYEELMTIAVADHDGSVLKARGEGDSTLSVFRRATDAAAAALAAQRSLVAEPWPDGVEFAVRMAIHTGEAVERDGDYLGPALNRAARLRALAAGGEIVVSQATAELLVDHLDEGVALRDAGDQTLAGLRRPERLYVVVAPDLAPIGDREPAATSQSPPAGLPAILSTARRDMFVGRRAELDLLAGVWAEVKDGALRAVLVAGEPGIGKTRLAAQFALAAAEDGATVLVGRCDEEPLVAYQPFVEALRSYVTGCSPAELRAQLGPLGGELTRLLPDLATRLPGLAPPLRGEPETERYRLFEATSDLLVAASARAPLVLLLDDLHWADKPTLVLLRHLLRGARGARLLVMGTYRHTEVGTDRPLGETLADLQRDHLAERLLLRGFGEPEVAAFLSAWSGREAAEDLARTLYERTEGSPFFIGEVLRHLAETGALVESQQADGALPNLERVGLPEGVKQVVGRRLARLPEPCQRVLAVASVVGAEFGIAAVEAAADVGEDAVLEALDEAEGAEVIAAAARAGRYRFAHALIREVLYEQLGTVRRSRMHRRVGEVLEELYRGDIESRLPELAHHFCEAAASGDGAKAVGYAIRAGDRAVALLAYEEAAAHYQRALQVLEDADADIEMTDVLLALGNAQLKAGDIAGAKRTFLQAAERARARGDAERLGLAALRFGASSEGLVTELAASVDRSLVGLLEEGLAALPPDDNPLRARLLGRLALALYAERGAAERRAELSRAAMEMAERCADPNARAAVLMCRLLALWGPDNVAERLPLASEVLQIAEESGDRERALQARGLRVMELVERGDVAAAAAEVDSHARMAGELRQPFFLGESALFRATLTILKGQFAEGERLAQEAFDLNQRAGVPNALDYFGAVMSSIWQPCEDLAVILAGLDQLHGDATKRYAPLRCALSYYCCVSGDVDEASVLFDELTADNLAAIPRDSTWLHSLAYLAETAALLRDRDRGARIYELLLPSAGRVRVGGPPVTGCTGLVSEHLGVLATALGRAAEAMAHFEEALQLASTIGALPFAARTHSALGELLLEQGHPGRAVTHLDQALVIAEELGMKFVAERVAKLKARAG